jgi:hypothetical protein
MYPANIQLTILKIGTLKNGFPRITELVENKKYGFYLKKWLLEPHLSSLGQILTNLAKF